MYAVQKRSRYANKGKYLWITAGNFDTLAEAEAFAAAHIKTEYKIINLGE